MGEFEKENTLAEGAKSIVNEMHCRRARPREGEVQIHLRRLGSHFHRIGWLSLSRVSVILFGHPATTREQRTTRAKQKKMYTITSHVCRRETPTNIHPAAKLLFLATHFIYYLVIL